MTAPINAARPIGSSSRFHANDDHGLDKSSHGNSPLPTPRFRSATVNERPRTSSGPDSRNTRVKAEAGRQLKSRDDSHIADMVATGTSQRSYHIPIRGKAPSPDSSPNSRSHSPHTTTIVRTTTPDSLPETAESGFVTIGMALGSPSHAASPAEPVWRPKPVSRAMTAQAAINEPQPQALREESPPKGKTRKWGIFGRSKSTKRGRSATGSAPSPPPTMQDQLSPPQARFMRQGGPQLVGSPVKSKPVVVRSQTAPLIGEVSSSRKVNTGLSYNQTTPMSRKPLPNQPVMDDRRPPPPTKTPRDMSKAQLLNVDIPSIEMERYSIMFGSVLQPNRGTSSLLARRQATLEKLRTLKDETTREEAREEQDLPLKPPPRRATSPNPGRQSPSFSLFPSTPAKPGTPQNPSPRGRSYTSPALLPSPSQPNFSPQEAEIFLQRSATPSTWQKRQKQQANQPSTPEGTERDSSRERARPHKPRSSSKLRTPQVFVESPKDITETPLAIHHDNKPLPALQEDEPVWQMVSQTSLASSTSTATADAASPSIRSQASTPAPVAQETRKPVEDDAQRALRDAVENSIRRQISMSQQQRQMLRPQHLNASPLATHSSSRKDASPQGVGIAKNVVPRVIVGKNERLAETKTSTPTLVHPGMEGRSALTNRKSERIVLDSAY